MIWVLVSFVHSSAQTLEVQLTPQWNDLIFRAKLRFNYVSTKKTTHGRERLDSERGTSELVCRFSLFLCSSFLYLFASQHQGSMYSSIYSVETGP